MLIFQKKLAPLMLVAVMAISFFGVWAMATPLTAQTLRENILSDELQDVASKSYNETTEIPGTQIQDIVVYIINAILGLLGIIFLVLIIYAGFLWMTAGGNDDQVGKAKSLLINAIIGVVIIVAAYAISYFVLNSLINPS